MNENEIKKLFDLVYPYENLKRNKKEDKLWEDTALCSGYPGVILFISDYLKKKNLEGSIDQYVQKMIDAYNNMRTIDLSLFSGLSGVSFALSIIDYNKYESLINQSTNYIIDNLMIFTNAIDEDDLKFEDYDLMSGLCGILLYLIYYYHKKPSKRLLNKIELSINKLLLIYDKNKFFVKSQYFFTEVEQKNYPNGGFNIGLSHGITGFLAVLIKYSDITNINHRTKINNYKNKIYNDLISDGYNSHERYVWPQIKTISFCKIEFAFFDSWCYGPPSIIYHLYKVAKENHRINDKTMFEEMMKNIAKDIQGITSPSFCHGYAGLLTIFIEFNKLAGKEIIEENILNSISEKIMEFYNHNDFPFYENHYDIDSGRKYRFKDLGLLTGISGIGLSLLHLQNQNSLQWFQVFTL